MVGHPVRQHPIADQAVARLDMATRSSTVSAGVADALLNDGGVEVHLGHRGLLLARRRRSLRLLLLLALEPRRCATALSLEALL